MLQKKEYDLGENIKGKEKLVDETIDEIKLTQHEIILRLYQGLDIKIKELKAILFKDLAVTKEAMEVASKISNIAFQLQACLDNEKGGEIAKRLHWLYRYIRYMAKRIIDDKDMNYVAPAHQVVELLIDGWSKMDKKHIH